MAGEISRLSEREGARETDRDRERSRRWDGDGGEFFLLRRMQSPKIMREPWEFTEVTQASGICSTFRYNADWTPVSTNPRPDRLD